MFTSLYQIMSNFCPTLLLTDLVHFSRSDRSLDGVGDSSPGKHALIYFVHWKRASDDRYSLLIALIYRSLSDRIAQAPYALCIGTGWYCSESIKGIVRFARSTPHSPEKILRRAGDLPATWVRSLRESALMHNATHTFTEPNEPEREPRRCDRIDCTFDVHRKSTLSTDKLQVNHVLTCIAWKWRVFVSAGRRAEERRATGKEFTTWNDRWSGNLAATRSERITLFGLQPSHHVFLHA